MDYFSFAHSTGNWIGGQRLIVWAKHGGIGGSPVHSTQRISRPGLASSLKKNNLTGTSVIVNLMHVNRNLNLLLSNALLLSRAAVGF